MRDVVIFIRSVFDDNNKYYPGLFLDECIHKLTK